MKVFASDVDNLPVRLIYKLFLLLDNKREQCNSVLHCEQHYRGQQSVLQLL